MGTTEKKLRVAAVQLSPVLFDRDGTTEKVINYIAKCGREDIRLAVFPETFIPNYPYFAWLNPPATTAELHGRLHEQAVEIPGPVTEALGALICWEHYMPLARYALIAQGEQIHCSHFPGAMAGDSMAQQIDAAIRHHAMESGAFVVNATGWLTDRQRAEIAPDASLAKYLKGGNCTGIVAPYGVYLAGPLGDGEDMALAEIDLNAIVRQKNVLDTAGHYSRPDIFKLSIDRSERRVFEEMEQRFDEIEKEDSDSRPHGLDVSE